MNTIQEFIAFCEQHKTERFWYVVDDIRNEAVELQCQLWREAIASNTDNSLNFKMSSILAKYKQGCALFGADKFNQDLTQFFNDNKE